jgi:acylphosphatase
MLASISDLMTSLTSRGILLESVEMEVRVNEPWSHTSSVSHAPDHDAVQGGLSAFVYRLATELGLGGWVRNSSHGVVLEVEGDPDRVEAFLLRIDPEKPPLASIHSLEPFALDACGESQFEILASDVSGDPVR